MKKIRRLTGSWNVPVLLSINNNDLSCPLFSLVPGSICLILREPAHPFNIRYRYDYFIVMTPSGRIGRINTDWSSIFEQL